MSATFENEIIATVENEGTQTDWVGDLSGGLGAHPKPALHSCGGGEGDTP